MAFEKPDPTQHGGQAPDLVNDYIHNNNTHKSDLEKPKEKEPDNLKQLSRGEKDKRDPPYGHASKPIAHAPPGYTVKIIFHQAARLPMADFASLSSDPFLMAQVDTDLQRRHQEDPPLKFRTKTVWNNTNPEWNQEWILDHVPASGFKMKCRLYDEDQTNRDDRLGNVHITVGRISENWEGIHSQAYKVKKKTGSWRAYCVRAMAVGMSRTEKSMHGNLYVSIEVLGRTPGDDGGRCYTIGPNYWCKHYSPLLGRIANSRAPDDDDGHENGKCNTSSHTYPTTTNGTSDRGHQKPYDTSRPLSIGGKTSTRYNFQANQFQLRGPVPPELYHRYVDFRPFVETVFTKKGLRGLILSKALHHQHLQIYNFNRHTNYGCFRAEIPGVEMTRQFLELVHYDYGNKIFTYVLTLDALWRFTETGKEYGIDLLSKHTMHSDVSIYIAFSGEFLIRRLQKPHSGRSNIEKEVAAGQSERQGGVDDNVRHPAEKIAGGPFTSEPPRDPHYYELVIDNDSGTYRPKGEMLPHLRSFLQMNLPGLKIVTLDCQRDKDLMTKVKSEQRERKKKESRGQVYTQISRGSSVSSSDEESWDKLEEQGGQNN